MSFATITPEIAKEKSAQKFNCAQIVFAHGAYFLGLDEETALKIAAAFGGGMGKGDICGV